MLLERLFWLEKDEDGRGTRLLVVYKTLPFLVLFNHSLHLSTFPLSHE